MKAIVIIPCLNEEKTIKKVIDKLRKVSKNSKINFKIIGVDDASNDNTLTILKKNADVVVQLKKRVPLVEVIKTGLKEALKHKADLLIHIDADEQYNAYQVLKLIEPISKKEADFVIGVRNVWKHKHMPFYKKIGNSFFTKLVSFLLDYNLKDAQSGFRVMKYDIIKHINLISKHTYTQEELIQVIKKGYKIKQIPINFNERKYGDSRLIKNPFEYAFRVFFDIIKIFFKN